MSRYCIWHTATACCIIVEHHGHHDFSLTMPCSFACLHLCASTSGLGSQTAPQSSPPRLLCKLPTHLLNSQQFPTLVFRMVCDRTQDPLWTLSLLCHMAGHLGSYPATCKLDDTGADLGCDKSPCGCADGHGAVEAEVLPFLGGS